MRELREINRTKLIGEDGAPARACGSVQCLGRGRDARQRRATALTAATVCAYNINRNLRALWRAGLQSNLPSPNPEHLRRGP